MTDSSTPPQAPTLGLRPGTMALAARLVDAKAAALGVDWSALKPAWRRQDR